MGQATIKTNAPIADDQIQSFTSRKLDWLSALCADPRLTPQDFKTGFCIMQHVNQSTGAAFVSDETIADKTSSTVRTVVRSRANLKRYGWLRWRPTRTANVYQPLDGPMNAVIDHQILLKDGRDERRKKRVAQKQATPKLAYQKPSATPTVAHQATPKLAYQATPPLAYIHLGKNTLEGTPLNILTSEQCGDEELPL